MKILVFSMGPLFQHHVHGGSQKVLSTILRFLSEAGHQCTVYTGKHENSREEFIPFPNVRVIPLFDFYPAKHYVTPYHLVHVIQTLHQAVSLNDVFYIHDSELPFHFIYRDVPTVSALRDFTYPETLLSAFSFERDRIIVNSDYVARCVKHSLGTFRANLPLVTVYNGFDGGFYQKASSEQVYELRKTLGIPHNAIAILYPHRPEATKGIFQTLEIISKLRKRLPIAIFERLRLLVPRWFTTDPNATVYRKYIDYAKELGLEHMILLHDWVPQQLMPVYYSIGRVTFCVGNFVEAFSNVSIESELCGTPVLVARVGCHRTLLPDSLVDKADYGDTETFADRAAAILLGQTKVERSQVRDFILEKYDEQRQMKQYVEQIVSTSHREPATFVSPSRLSTKESLIIPPWCEVTESGYFNDYCGCYLKEDHALLEVVRRISITGSLVIDELQLLGVATERIYNWVHDGLLAVV